MAEYIEREALLNADYDWSYVMVNKECYIRVADVEKCLSSLPAADVVERSSFEAIGQKYAQIQDKLIRGELAPVVRCKDCVLHERCRTENAFKFARIDNPFCCVGVRRAEE